MPNADAWRVVLATGQTREVDVEPWPGMKCWRAVWRTTSGAIIQEAIAPSQRAAVAGYAGDSRWLVSEILAPSETTRAEAVAAAVIAEREACADIVAAWARRDLNRANAAHQHKAPQRYAIVGILSGLAGTIRTRVESIIGASNV